MTDYESTQYEPDEDLETTDTEAAGDVADKVAEEQEQGYVGTTPDPRPNEDYAVGSGEATGRVEDPYTRLDQPARRPEDDEG